MTIGRYGTTVPFGICVALMVAGCGESEPPRRAFEFTDADRLREPFHVRVAPDGSWVSYALGDTLWVVPTTRDRRAFEAIPISAGVGITRSQDPFMAWSPDGRRLVFQADPEGTAEQNLAAPIFVAEFSEDRLLGITPMLDGTVSSRVGRVINAGNFGPVIRTRWGGPAWSPDARRVAFLGWPTDDEAAAVQLYVADLETDSLEPWTDDQFLKTGVAWHPDGKRLTLARLTERGGGRIELIEGDAVERRTNVVFEGEAPLGDLLWAPDARRLFVRPGRGGPFILEVAPNGVGEVTQELPSAAYVGWTPEGTRLLASVAEGMGAQIALVEPVSGTIQRLTGTDTLFAVTSVGGREGRTLAAFTTEAGDLPVDAWVARVDTRQAVLHDRRRVSAANDWLDSVAVAQARVYLWPAADGEMLRAQLLLPADYDGSQPLPVVVMPYGAYSNAFANTQDFMTRGLQILVARGVAVVRPNTRGVASERQTDGYGEIQLADTHLLLDALTEDGIIDPERVALFGHSHGGAMVYYYLSHSDRFVGGIAVNGAADWVFQAKRRDMTGLPWGLGGPPEELPEKYKRFSPLENADAVSAPVLAIAGAGDTQIPVHNATVMVDRLRALGKPAELLLFEDEDHWIRDPENVREFWNRVLAFLQDVLIW